MTPIDGLVRLSQTVFPVLPLDRFSTDRQLGYDAWPVLPLLFSWLCLAMSRLDVAARLSERSCMELDRPSAQSLVCRYDLNGSITQF